MNTKELYQTFADHEEGQWIISLEDAETLDTILSKLRPKSILELGGGIGAATAVLSKHGKVESVEQYQKCIDVAKELIPEERQKNITFNLPPTMAWETKEIPFNYFNCYQQLPRGEWDFVFLDGPGPFWYEGALVELPNGDVFTFMKDMKSNSLLMIDGRATTAYMILIYLNPWLQPVRVEQTATMFKRTAKPFDIAYVQKLRQESIISKHGKLPT